MDRMPDYYNVEDWEGLESVKVIPCPWYRRCPILKTYLPYRVGDQISFKLLVKKNSIKSHYVIAEKFGEKETLMGVIDKAEYQFTGTEIPTEGVVAYYIVNNENGSRIRKKLIFTTFVLSKDTIRAKFGWMIFSAIFGAILGGIVTLVITLVFGFIQFTPAFRAIWRGW